MTVKEAIKEIIKLRGLLIFNDYNKFKAMLLDFGNSNQKELNVFKTAVDEKMLKLCIDDSLENSRKITKIKIQLEDKGFSDNAIDFVIDSFAFALGWNYTPREPQKQIQKAQQQPQQASSQTDWTCSCGTVNAGNFCSNCGSPKPVPKSNDWTCVCGTVNTTNFCINCGKPKRHKFNPFIDAKVGDVVKMGIYPQTRNGDIQPIEWQVLLKEWNKMLVISKYGLDTRRFDSSSNDWSSSEIRKWSNSDFYNKAFTEQEKKYMSSFNGDYVFLLSKEESEKYLNYYSRRCKATDYAVKNGCWLHSNGYNCWWLCSSNPNYTDIVFFVFRHGGFGNRYVYINKYVVRPALWINL